MANITKIKRDEMVKYLHLLKEKNNDDQSISALNEIENALTEKKFGLVFEEHTEEADEKLKDYIPVLCADDARKICKDPKLPYNFIIEGDNLHALYLLEKTHKGKVDCIYIDPPYNTGTHDWKYNNNYVDENDEYRHSKWLSMMQSRLRIAKRLLNPKESVLICTIDEKEFLHLGCLLEEMFPEGRIQMISSVINPAGAGRSKDFSRTDEYIFCVQLGTSSVIPESRDLENVPVIWDTLRRSSLANARGMHGKGACGPNQFFPIYVNEETGKIVKIGTPIPEGVDRKTAPQMKGCCAVFPVRPDGTEMNWGIKPEEAEQRLEKGYLRAGKHQNEPQQYVISYITGGNIEDIESGKAIIEKRNDDGSVVAYYPSGRDKMPTTNWNKPLHDAQRYGTNVIKAFIGNRFPYPKSLYAVRDILKCFLLNKPNATVVDFFAGSGTTLHALFLLNAEDGGTRHGILVTNNEISEAEEKKMTKLGYKKGDAKWEALGIANYVTWPRIVAAITGVNVNGQPAVGQYVDLGLPYSSGFSANVKYFKCNWIERRPANYLLSNALCLHIKEMIELQNAIEVDNKAYILILSHQDYLDYVQNSESKESIKQIWVNQNIIFSISEIRDLKQYRFRYVPKEYFGQELKEVAE